MAGIEHDAIIAGAGPAGLHAAYCCERLGLDVLLLEEHAAIGRPNHCSGLISANIRKFVPLKSEFVEHEVKGAILHPPNGSEVRLEKPGTAAYVVDRAKFDNFLASRVKSKIRFKSRIDAFTVLDDRVVVKAGGKAYDARCVIACDGSNSLVRKQMGVRPKEMLNGVIAVTKEANSSGFVDIWYDKKRTDGFVWKIPRGCSTEYGMLGTKAGLGQLKEFFGLTGKCDIRGGLIPLGPPKTYFDRVLLVGDAACQAKPWSGGGVIYSLAAAGMAARTVKDAADQNDFSEKSLKVYEDGWKQAFGRQIRLGMLARSAYRRMGNRGINLALGGAGRAGFLLNRLDMDFVVGV